MKLLSRLRSSVPAFASTPHVLLVEDKISDAHVVREILESAGAVVVLADSADDARIAIKCARFDLIMVDLALAGVGDALDFVAELRGTSPVVALVEHEAAGISAMFRGAVTYVVKGVMRAMELVSAATRALRDGFVQQSSPPRVVAEHTRARTAQILERVNTAVDAATRQQTTRA